MEAVHILGEHPAALEAALHEGQELVGTIEACTAAGILEPVQVLPGELGLAPEGARRQDLLNGQVAFCVLDVVEPADASVGGEPRLRGDARARDEQDAASTRKNGDGTFELTIHAQRVSVRWRVRNE